MTFSPMSSISVVHNAIEYDTDTVRCLPLAMDTGTQRFICTHYFSDIFNFQSKQFNNIEFVLRTWQLIYWLLVPDVNSINASNNLCFFVFFRFFYQTITLASIAFMVSIDSQNGYNHYLLSLFTTFSYLNWVDFLSVLSFDLNRTEIIEY